MGAVVTVLKVVSYLSLGALTLAAMMVTAPISLGVCVADEARRVTCETPFWSQVFDLGFFVLNASVATILPLGLALAGLWFFLRSLTRRRPAG